MTATVLNHYRIVKPWWPRWIACDWGFSHFAAVGWFASGMLSVEEIADYFGLAAIAPVRVLVQYRELVTNEVPEPDLARLILHRTPESERPHVRYCYIGHDAFAKKGSANTVAEQMDAILAPGGLPRLNKADIDRVGGWRLLYNCFASARRLRNWKGGSFDPFDERTENAPALFISGACPETISAIPLLISDYDPISRPNGDPKDVRKMAGQVSDDVADMLRYGVKSYLAAEPTVPMEVAMGEMRRSYPPTAEGNTRLMNRMRAEEAKQHESLYLRRKVRGR
jgi:hypothetical protein